MSTESNFDEYAENDVPRYVNGPTSPDGPVIRSRNPEFRQASAAVHVEYEYADAAQIETAIDAVRNANDAAYDHLVTLLRGAREREHKA